MRCPKIQDGVAVVRMRHLAEKISTHLKLLIISIHVPNFSFLTQLFPEIWSPISHWFNITGPRNGFLGF